MICRTCLYPSTKPDLHFDETGQCSACRNYENRPQVDWHVRHQELMRLLDRFNGECLVGSSGGKDSTSIAIRLKELGADVTAVTARTCMLTDVGRMNIDNLAKYVKTIEVVPNMSERAELNRIGLDLVGDINWIQHAAIFSTPFRVAVETGKKLVFFGENSQDAYGGPRGSEKAKELTLRWISEFGGLLGLRPQDIEGFDMTFYTPPKAKDMEGVEAHFLGAYLPWDSHANAAVAIKHGMRTYGKPPGPQSWWEWENIDDSSCGIHCHFMKVKYGYTRADAQLSVDIRSGRITREQALVESAKRRGFPYEYCGVPFEEVLDRIGMKVERFRQIERQFAGDINCLESVI